MSSRGSGSPDSRWAPRIATIRGIPIRVHLSFGLVMLFLLWRTGSASGLRVAALEQVFIVAVFACVGLHELAHAVTALRHGLPISGITLYPFGGVARMGRRPPSGRLEVTIAAAGPIANLLIAAAILALTAGRVLAPGDSLALRMLGMLFWANLILAGFNLLPAFPLDGGRVFRGLLTTRMGWARATVWAASVGQVVGAVLIAAAAAGREAVRPGAPAFWAAFGVPASMSRRGRAGVEGEGCDRAVSSSGGLPRSRKTLSEARFPWSAR
jgi:Zn-dependent protease